MLLPKVTALKWAWQMWICTGSSAALVQSSHTRTNHSSRKCLSRIQERESELTVLSIFFKECMVLSNYLLWIFSGTCNRIADSWNLSIKSLLREGREWIQPDKVKQGDLGLKNSWWGISIVCFFLFTPSFLWSHFLLNIKWSYYFSLIAEGVVSPDSSMFGSCVQFQKVI